MNTEQIIQIARECGAYFGNPNDWVKYNLVNEKDVILTREQLEQFAARAVELETPQWQPIETAPRGGTEVLLGYYSDDCGEQQIVARWNSIQNTWCTPHKALKSAGDYSPTHWMPLPKPPRSL